MTTAAATETPILVERWGYAEDPEVVTAFVRSARTPGERTERWANLIVGAVRRWHEDLAAAGFEPVETPRAETMWRWNSDLFERNLLGLVVTGRVVPKGSRS